MSPTESGEFRLSIAKVNSSILVLLGSGALGVAYALFLGSIVIAAVMAVAVVGAAWWWRRGTVNDRAVRLSVQAGGIHAPEVTDKPVPWSALNSIILSANSEGGSNRRRRGMGGFLVLNLKDDPRQYGPKEGKYFGGSSLTITVDELDGTHQDFFNLIAKHAPGLEVVEK